MDDLTPGQAGLAEAGNEDGLTESLELAAARCATLPAALLVDVARRAAGSDARVAAAAMAAVLRRVAMVETDRLVVANRPHRRIFGVYSVRPARKTARPYATVLRSIAPLVGSCSCPDFARASLGLCKHLITVLAALHRRPRQVARALREQEVEPVLPRVSWDPIRPLAGVGDWLERVVVAAGERRKPHLAGVVQSSSGRLKAPILRHPVQRARAVAAILAIARADAWDPALIQLLERERDLLGRADDGRELVRRYRALAASLRRVPYPFQADGIRRFLAVGRMLLADDMGLGKTTQAIAACHVLFTSGRAKRGLIIAPASLKLQWAREWERTSATPVRVVDGPRSARESAYRETTAGFLVLNYEQLLRDADLAQAFEPDIVVLDEAQRIKNWSTKTSAAVKALTPPYRLVLTGTPLENRLEELASIYDWVDDLALEPKWRLAPWHTFDDGNAGGQRGVRHLDTLRTRMAATMTRRVRSEVIADLPPRTDTRVPVELTRAQVDAHADLDQPIARLAMILRRRGLTHDEFTRLMRLLTMQRMICSGMALCHFVAMWPEVERASPGEAAFEHFASPKLGELRALVVDLVIRQGRKVAIFSQWRRMLQLASWAIGDLLEDAGVRALFFTGSESQKERDGNIQRFHDDPQVRILFLTDAGGVGLNLQRAATACVNLELPWNPAVLEQRIGRIHRIGQESPIDVFNIVSESGIEARIAKLVADKRQAFDALFDGTSDRVVFEGATRFADKLAELVDVAETVDEGTPTAPPPSVLEQTIDVDREDVTAGGSVAEPDPPLAGDIAPPPPAPPSGAAPLLSVERTADGIVVRAPPEVRDMVASLFEQLSRAFREPPP